MENKKRNPVVHFEMPAVNKKRTAEFYSKVFGWNMKQYGPEMGDYLLAYTTETNKKTGFPTRPGRINGGFFKKGKEGKIPHVVIAVGNLKQHMEIVKKNNGKIEGKPMHIQGIGDFVMFKDTEGNRVGMLQPLPM